MSYDVRLRGEDGETVEFNRPHHMKGGTYVLGGTTLAELNVTYNYSKILHQVLTEVGPRGGDKHTGGIRSLYGLAAWQSIPILMKAIEQLQDNVVDDYWEPTEGNVKAALKDLLQLALLSPSGSIWDGD